MLAIEGDTQGDVWAIPLDGKAKAQSLLATKFNERNARFSPDGRWVAYSSNESGIDEVYVQPCPSLAGKWQISTRGGDQAVWSRHGRMLYYRGGGQVRAVEIMPAATLQLSTPVLSSRTSTKAKATPTSATTLRRMASSSSYATIPARQPKNTCPWWTTSYPS